MKRFSFFLLFLLVAIPLSNAQKVKTPAPALPPTWSQLLPASERFVLVLNGEAVLDNETGLVWERSPSSDPILTGNYWDAVTHRANRTVGGRKGWRLPDTAELSSLIDPSQQDPNLPMLPAGHPFQNVQLNVYWVTLSAGAGGLLVPVDLLTGRVSIRDSTFIPVYCWCVRSGNTN